MNKITSPCIRNCCLDENNICLGCFRSITEIMQWNSSTEQEKQQIIQLAGSRKNIAALKETSQRNK